MPDEIINDVSRRHDFVLLFDVVDGNPNGDPDAGNLPRVDPETMQGLVTDVCIKRKVRDYVDLTHGTEERNKIYVQHRGILANQQKRAFDALGHKPTDDPDDEARLWMCRNFFDIRMFGAVMAVGKAPGGKKYNCGQVRGPLQLTFARSIDKVYPQDVPITRVALTNADDIRRDRASQRTAAAEAATAGTNSESGAGDEEVARSGQMGRKAMIPYGLYRTHGFFNPHLAKQTEGDSDDLALFWQALQSAWDFDRSAARGLMACRGLYVFTHDSPLGNAPAHRLFEQIVVAKKEGAEVPRSFGDYAVTVNEPGLPAGVTLTALVS
jgi:CRISPR-associated protein Csd2